MSEVLTRCKLELNPNTVRHLSENVTKSSAMKPRSRVRVPVMMMTSRSDPYRGCYRLNETRKNYLKSLNRINGNLIESVSVSAVLHVFYDNLRLISIGRYDANALGPDLLLTDKKVEILDDNFRLGMVAERKSSGFLFFLTVDGDKKNRKLLKHHHTL